MLGIHLGCEILSNCAPSENIRTKFIGGKKRRKFTRLTAFGLLQKFLTWYRENHNMQYITINLTNLNIID